MPRRPEPPFQPSRLMELSLEVARAELDGTLTKEAFLATLPEVLNLVRRQRWRLEEAGEVAGGDTLGMFLSPGYRLGWGADVDAAIASLLANRPHELPREPTENERRRARQRTRKAARRREGNG